MEQQDANALCEHAPRLPAEAWPILVCPTCRSALRYSVAGASCAPCDQTYPWMRKGGIDLRPRRAIEVSLPISIPTFDSPPEVVEVSPLEPNASPEVDFAGVELPRHMSAAQLSHVPRARGPRAMCLDLGCGKGQARASCEHAGYHYVGLDSEAEKAPMLGDAHALPFESGSFELVLSMGVLERSAHPIRVAQEIARVLAPGGVVLGTAAFLEPFHDTYYHQTHLGLIHTLRQAGLEILRVASHRGSALRAQQRILLGRLPGGGPNAELVERLFATHREWWNAGLTSAEDPNALAQATADGFTFLARKGPHRAADATEAEPARKRSDEASSLREVLFHQQKSLDAMRRRLLEATELTDGLVRAVQQGSRELLRQAAKRAAKWNDRLALWPAPSSTLPPEIAALLRVPGAPRELLLPLSDGSGLVSADGARLYPIRDGVPCLCPSDARPARPGARPTAADKQQPRRLFLDIGTKTGNGFADFVLHYMPLLGRKRSDIDAVVGVDLSESRLRAARANGIVAMRADATALPFADGAFEVTVITELIEHVPAELAVNLLREARRVTRGAIFIQHPDFTSEPYLASVGLKFVWMDWRVHVHHVTVDSMRALLAEAGLAGYDVEQVFPVVASDHEELVALDAPPELARFDASVHTKPDVKFDRPVFEKMRVVVSLDGRQHAAG